MKILAVILLAVILNLSLFAQAKLIRLSQNNNSIKLTIQLNDIPLNSVDFKKNIIKNVGYFDESKPGKFSLPEKDLFVAIPYPSHPSIDYNIVQKHSFYWNLGVNPQTSISKDSSIYYNFFPLPVKDEDIAELIVFKGFLWIDDVYSMHFKIKQYSYDDVNKQISVIENLELNLTFNKIINNGNVHIEESNDRKHSIFINADQAAKFAVTYPAVIQDDTLAYWINYQKSYIKMGVAKDGIYRITYNDFINLGIDPSAIIPGTINIYNKGKKTPIYVNEEFQSSFSQNCYIEFVGLKNMGGHHREISAYGQPYNEYLGKYTDTTIYWLTWNENNPERVMLDSIGNADAQDTLVYYSHIDHYEKDYWFDYSTDNLVRREDPFWIENKTWGWGGLGLGIRSYPFQVSDVYSEAQVKLFAKLQGYASSLVTNSYLLSLSLNNYTEVYDSGYVNKYQKKVLFASLNSDQLNTGINYIKIHSYPTPSTVNLCFFDWYEIEYPRYLSLINNSLTFRFNYLSSAKSRFIKLLNTYQSKYIIWKYGSKYKKITKYYQQGTVLVFNDTVENNSNYIIISEDKISTPKFYYKKNFRNLRSAANQADYVAITNKLFIPEAKKYTDFISSRYNLRAELIDVDDIYDEFAFGYFNPESIKSFLKAVHSYWQNPHPKYVFLIGGATYDYHRNKELNLGAPKIENYVPSFGAPVSDAWFVVWDTTGANIPQMNIGRLPVTSVAQFQHYFDKHEKYIEQEYDEWNKRYLFFSGGNYNDKLQIEKLKATNDYIIDSMVVPPPIGGAYHHFYKTSEPITNYGPYKDSEVQNAIKQGSVFISYLGHSGTQTWDNGIADPAQLNNDAGRYPLITDYGCSTAKFAEPDITSFSQLFVTGLNGQAIAYIGNSSLGFFSTTITFPKLFYSQILKDFVFNIGDAHRLAKIDLISKYGSSGVNGLFVLTNTLIGDPIVSLPVPAQPNLKINYNNVSFTPNIPTDANDSLQVKIAFENTGMVIPDSFNIKIIDENAGIAAYQLKVRKKIPLFIDSLTIYIPIKNKHGEHILRIVLDEKKSINEINEDDNETSIKYNVVSASLKNLVQYSCEYETNGLLKILNPVYQTTINKIDYEISLDKYFKNSVLYTIPMGDFITPVSLNKLYANKRIWLRSRLSNSESSYGISQSFFFGTEDSYLLNDSLTFAECDLENLIYSNNQITFSKDSVRFEVISAGFNDGNTAIISKDFKNYIPENTLRGHHVCIFDTETLEFIKYYHFDIFGQGTPAVNEYASLLDTIDSSYLVIFAVSDEGSSNLTAALKNKIKEFGSRFIDSLKFRNSWAMIGRKGAAKGSVPEKFSKTYTGRVQIDTVIIKDISRASLETSIIGPASEWGELVIGSKLLENAKIIIQPIGIRTGGLADTLKAFSFVQDTISLKFIDARNYEKLKFNLEIFTNSSERKPALTFVKVKYKSPSELGTNYQAASAAKDSILIGENQNLQFYVYNVGESAADSFNVMVEVINTDNSRIKIFETTVDRLNSESRKLFNVNYTSSSYTGSKYFYITIDPENKIKELYKDNNVYSIPFYVKPDTSHPSIKITFDGTDIMNGDYVSSNPNIRIEINDPSLLPITDTSAISITLNDLPIFYADNTADLSYQLNSANPKMVVNYNPALMDGNYTLKVMGKNAIGNVADSLGIIKKFTVVNKQQLLYVYNYPNPFKNGTHFTFKLTQIPDELKIMVYTIAGRLIKVISKFSSELKYDFNRIYWDGKDEEGDLIGSGIYFYKIILRKGGESRSVIQKAAVIR